MNTTPETHGLTVALPSAEQLARDMLERIGMQNAQSRTAGDVGELANLIAAHRAAIALLGASLGAWEGEEDSVKAEHAGHIAKLQAFYDAATSLPLDEADEPDELDCATKAAAVEYVNDEYCIGSNDNIETDADENSPPSEFSVGDDGIWVRGWLFYPRPKLTDGE